MNLANDEAIQAGIKNLQERIRTEVEGLGSLIDARVRYEQRRDQLTKLSNDLALQETIEDAIVSSKHFWVAFVEVDKFKRINDEFGYLNADELLKGIAELLSRIISAFPKNAQAFRAHGDEFYLFGEAAVDSDYVLGSVGQNLEQVRLAVEKLALPISTTVGQQSPQTPPTMNCTVSVGWATSVDVTDGLRARHESLTARGMLTCLEHAVGEAKRQGRNRVVRYNDDHTKSPLDSQRGDCPTCHCKFSFDVQRDKNKLNEDFHCPNCGERVPRGTSSAHSPVGSHPGVVHLDPIDTTEKQ